MDKRAQETFNNLHKGVVLVICRAANENDRSVSTGSGFIIGKTERGYLVMTCYHVIKNHPKLSVRIPSDDKDTKEYAAQVVKVALEENEMELFHKQVDLVVIEVYGLTRECQVLEFCDPGAVEDVAPETDVFILGYINRPTRKGSPSTLNLKPTVSPGSICTPPTQHVPGAIQDVVYTAASIHGTSGCPAIFRGKVLGVHFEMETGRHACYARSANTVNTVFKEWLQIDPNVSYCPL